MRIAYLITGLRKGGGETQLARLAIEMAKTDTVHVFALIDGGPIETQLREAGVPVTILGCNYANAFFRTRAAIKDFKPDIIHTYLWHANMLGRVVARSLRVPGINAIRLREQGIFRTVTERATRFLVDYYTSNSAAAPRAMGITSFTWTPNGVPDDFWNRARKPNKKYALMVAHLRVEKDHDTLLLVAKALPDWTFQLAGVGEREAELKKKAEELGLQNVEFLGLVKDVRPLLQKATCLIHLSFTEGMPNAIIEAMLAGVPVIASDIPENREVTEGHGELVPLQNRDAVIKAMKKLPWSTTATQRWAKKTFSIENMVDVNRKVYATVLKAKR